MKIMNGVVSSQLLALYHLFYFIACVQFHFVFFLSLFFIFFNVTGLVEPTESGSVYEKSQFHLTSTCLSEFLATEYLHETNKAIFMLCFIYGFLFFRCLEKVFGFQRRKKQEQRRKYWMCFNKLVTVERDRFDGNQFSQIRLSYIKL